ncbi:MAG: Maf family protein [Bacillota bacterium]|nr:Maf family protein [Bacillota bacterium]
MIKYNAGDCRYRLVLASGSPRRIEMFRQRGFSPEVLPAEVDEELEEGLSLEQTVMYLALKKALWTEERLLEAEGGGPEDGKALYVVAADTVVYLDRIIGKPVDERDALAILRELRGREHTVASGVALIKAGSGLRRIFCRRTRVWFKEYTDQDILRYIATGEPADKAGAYAIQGGWGPYVDHIDGDYDNVLGFPWKQFREEFAAMAARG